MEKPIFVGTAVRLRSAFLAAGGVASIALSAPFAGADRASAWTALTPSTAIVPKVNVPTVNVPKVNVPTVSVPTSVPKVNVPTVSVPNIHVPTAKVNGSGRAACGRYPYPPCGEGR